MPALQHDSSILISNYRIKFIATLTEIGLVNERRKRKPYIVLRGEKGKKYRDFYMLLFVGPSLVYTSVKSIYTLVRTIVSFRRSLRNKT